MLLGGSFGAYFSYGIIDYSVEKLVAVGLGFLLDHLSHLLSSRCAIGKGEAAMLGRYLCQLLDDVEESGLVSAAQVPTLRDCAGQDLLVGPVVSGNDCTCIGARERYGGPWHAGVRLCDQGGSCREDCGEA